MAAATCTKDGTKEYWSCSVCGKFFADAQGDEPLETVTIAASGHKLTHHAEADATCEKAGNVEYWSCSECGKNFDASEANELVNVGTPVTEHVLVHYEATETTAEYWECSECGTLFADAAAASELSEVPVVADEHAAEVAGLTAVPVPAAVPEGEDGVSFAANDRSFSEAYATLNEEQKRYFILLCEYALHKQNATETRTSRGVVIRSDKKIILKLIIRRGIVVAAFKLENDLLRDYRRNSEAAGAFRLKETEPYIESENAPETACGMVDLMLQQYAREREEAIRRRRARQAARRAKKRAERLRAAQAKQDAAEAPAEETPAEAEAYAEPAEEAAEEAAEAPDGEQTTEAPAEAEAYAEPAEEAAEEAAEAPDGEQTAREE